MKKLGNLYILGDSYSTFEGYIPPTHEYWYKTEKQTCTDVTNVEETWWKIVLENTDVNLILNDSWSGTTICHTGYSGCDASNRSFVTRFDKHIEEGFFDENKIDTVFVFGGTNDNWANSPLGELKHSDWSKEDLYQTLPAIGYLFNRLATILPETRIIIIINEGFKPEISNALIETAKRYNFEYLPLKNIDKMEGHPCISGMAQIAQQVLEII